MYWRKTQDVIPDGERVHPLSKATPQNSQGMSTLPSTGLEEELLESGETERGRVGGLGVQGGMT